MKLKLCFFPRKIEFSPMYRYFHFHWNKLATLYIFLSKLATLQQPLSYRLETFTDDKDAIKANYLLLHSSLFFSFGRWIMDRRLVLSLRLGILGFRDRKWTPFYIKVVHYSCLKVFVRALCAKSKVWKFQDFCITQFIREINFEHSRSAKSAFFNI